MSFTAADIDNDVGGELASEAAISPLYGGIHDDSAIEVWLEQGACVGEHINSLKRHQQPEDI